MHRILLLGAQGTLGNYLNLCWSNSFEIVSFSEKMTKKNKKFDELSELIERHKVNCIINTVGATNVNLCEQNLEYAFNGNTLVPSIIKDLQTIANGTIFTINFSSDQVYEGNGNNLESNVNPQNVYGESKLAGERFLTQNACNLRLNYVSKGTNRLSFSDWVVQSARSKEKVKLFSDVYFNPVDLSTVKNCIEWVLRRNIIGTFNIGSHSKISKSDFYMRLTERLGIVNPNIECVEYRAVSDIPRPLDMSMDITKAENFGFKLPKLNDVIGNLAVEYEN